MSDVEAMGVVYAWRWQVREWAKVSTVWAAGQEGRDDREELMARAAEYAAALSVFEWHGLGALRWYADDRGPESIAAGCVYLFDQYVADAAALAGDDAWN